MMHPSSLNLWLNYARLTWRNLIASPLTSLITVVGLAISFTCCILIVLFLWRELSYDAFHENADRIHRVNYTPLFVDGLEFARIPPTISPLLQDFFPEIEASARLYKREAVVGRQDLPEVQFSETDFYFADSTLIRLFDFEMINGSLETALRRPNAVAISDRLAGKFFGSTDPVGNILLIEGEHPFVVTGVFRSYPERSHITFDFLAAYDAMYLLESETASQNLPENWTFSHSYTYVLLRAGADASRINGRFGEFIETYAPERFHERIAFQLVPLRQIYLNSSAFMEPGPTGSSTNILIFSMVTILILIVACVNFINLHTARSLKRSLEIGIRKAMGASRGQIAAQFIAESTMISLAALLIAIVGAELLLPLINESLQLDLQLMAALDPDVMLAFLCIALATGIGAGIYPARCVSAFQPSTIVKAGGMTGQVKGSRVTRWLVIGQFSLTTLLLFMSAVIYQQLHFMQHQPMGFGKEQVIYNRLFSENLNNVFDEINPAFQTSLEAFRQEIVRHPGVRATSLANTPPGTGATYQSIVPEDHSDEDPLVTASMSVSFGFLETMKLDVIAGRGFSEYYGTDTEHAFIINQSAAAYFGWNGPEDVLGKSLRRGEKNGSVIGVVPDFHYESLKLPLGPLVLDIAPSNFSYVLVSLSGADLGETIAFIEQSWRTVFPGKPFDYQFLDETIASFYETEIQTARVTRYAAGIAIFISLMGLFGLMTLLLYHRTREIGIRMVLGSSISGIVVLLTRGMLGLIVVACIVAAPVGWYGMERWLQHFAYRIQMDAWIYVQIASFILLLTLVLTGTQALRVALRNPIKSLRQP